MSGEKMYWQYHFFCLLYPVLVQWLRTHLTQSPVVSIPNCLDRIVPSPYVRTAGMSRRQTSQCSETKLCCKIFSWLPFSKSIREDWDGWGEGWDSNYSTGVQNGIDIKYEALRYLWSWLDLNRLKSIENITMQVFLNLGRCVFHYLKVFVFCQ